MVYVSLWFLHRFKSHCSYCAKSALPSLSLQEPPFSLLEPSYSFLEPLVSCPGHPLGSPVLILHPGVQWLGSGTVPRGSIRWRRLQRQSALPGQPHHHCQPLLRREWHMPPRLPLHRVHAGVMPTKTFILARMAIRLFCTTPVHQLDSFVTLYDFFFSRLSVSCKCYPDEACILLSRACRLAFVLHALHEFYIDFFLSYYPFFFQSPAGVTVVITIFYPLTHVDSLFPY